MGFGRFVHLIGAAFLLVATALLIVSVISAPVINGLAIVKVSLGDNNPSGTSVIFGTFGYCIRGIANGGGDACSKTVVGYSPAKIINGLDDTDFGNGTRSTAKALTNVMVLHAVACGFAFIAFLLSIFTGIVGALMATLMSVATFIIIVVVLVCDFVFWSLIRHDVNKGDNPSDSRATFGPAIYCVLAAGVLSLLAAIIVFITCCAGRRKAKRHSHSTEPKGVHSSRW